MSVHSDSQQPTGPAFEIQQTENTITIITRDPSTREVEKVVTFRGRTDPEDCRWGMHRLADPVSPESRW